MMKELRFFPAAAALLVANGVAHSDTVRCPVRGIEAIEVAQARGYSSRATKRTGAGSCIISNNTGVAAETADGKGLSCRFEFFASAEGRAFASGWKRHSIEFRGAPYERVAGSTAEKPYIGVDVSADAGQTVTVSMGTLTLDGPDCAKWQDAFSAQ